MEDHGDPYVQPIATMPAHSVSRAWLANFFAATSSALVAIIWLFRAAERRHFGTATNDPALLPVALPYLLAAAVLAGLACSILRRRHVLRSALLGLVAGPAVAFLGYELYPLVHRWA
jgi:hypothetical protein